MFGTFQRPQYFYQTRGGHHLKTIVKKLSYFVSFCLKKNYDPSFLDKKISVIRKRKNKRKNYSCKNDRLSNFL